MLKVSIWSILFYTFQSVLILLVIFFIIIYIICYKTVWRFDFYFLLLKLGL